MSYIRDKKTWKTGYQERAPWSRHIDLECDFVMVYGFDHDLQSRIRQFKDQGYEVHFMTGISWGNYQDYLDGRYDGVTHDDDAQTDRLHQKIIHGTDATMPYMVPTFSYIEYVFEKLKKVVDLGVSAVHLEEPEFWLNAGYSRSFKEAYRAYFKEPWADQHENAEAMLKNQELKVYLFKRAIDLIAQKIKAYAIRTKNQYVPVYVPTHSLLNYAQWKIMSPEAELSELKSIDGYIAQVWTGTSREKNVYKGVEKERTFETAYLEYGVMKALAGNDKRIWFLNDPIEDNPGYTWRNYRYNYLKTLAASLLHGEVDDYEICPWPTRVFNRKLPEGQEAQTYIPADYDILLNHLFQMLGNMPRQSDSSSKVTILMSDTAMYQRQVPHDSEHDIMEDEASELTFSDFYGMILPLLKMGITLESTTIERMMHDDDTLDKIEILVMSYDFMKPRDPGFHIKLEQFLKKGKTILFVGSNDDFFQNATAYFGYRDKPFLHLTKALGIDPKHEDICRVSSGLFCYYEQRPLRIANHSDEHDAYMRFVKKIFERIGYHTPDQSIIQRRRGPYLIAANMDETDRSRDYDIKGAFYDMTSIDFDYRDDVSLKVDEVAILYDDRFTEHGTIIATTYRVKTYTIHHNHIALCVSGKRHMNGRIRMKVKTKPEKASHTYTYCPKSSTILIDITLTHKEENIWITF